ncbi:dsDNA nuclease domain-containing protein [Pseudomonas sp. BNK-45]|uniref:dsDNA nuclease domain-containing protein n=1 Tax=Pseudomonas sp. BNK-45 TaxID=3376180 RepID=UPI0039BF5470
MSISLPQDRWSAILNDPEINEIGGENNNEGVDYARYWAMALLVEMETKKTPDYVLLFEYLQDVAVLDKAEMPTAATLYQVKKKNKGNWSKSALTKKESPPK